MNKTILIDAAQTGEVRVAVVKDGQIDDFDIEAEDHKQLRGNIYLGKVTRVEPSLQAAFVEYGGNRQGFLAFDEIHPDYYQIPQGDRDALQAEVEAAMGGREETDASLEKVGETEAEDAEFDSEDNTEALAENGEDGADLDMLPSEDEAEDVSGDTAEEPSEDSDNGNEADEAREVGKRLRRKLSRRYKIQEVIRTRQVILVQVVKGERGTKGAALTTYLSLAGRYCVLMPSSMRGGGVSRKITNVSDRKRLKKIMSDFDIPSGMGLIVRTAGARQSANEIGDDYEYLLRLWSNIREKTLESVAPCLVHEESHLILRAVRDLYDNDVSAVHVSGEETHAEVEAFFEQIIPDQKDCIHFHDDAEGPLFSAHGVEVQLDELFSPQVPLPSGGYMVIHQTEALVAIDVNSGKATRERNIEKTAVRTNEEAAVEAARQMRLRDLAGLLVIDFIDMEETRNIRNIERRMKDALSVDRARVHMGRISRFGLMEISRQRRRIGVMEASSAPCAICAGTGRVRSPTSIALKILRVLRELLYKVNADRIEVEARRDTIMHLLNHKRSGLVAIEAEYGLPVAAMANNDLAADEFLLFKVVKERRSELAEPRHHSRRPTRASMARDSARSTEKKQRRPRRSDHEQEAQAPTDGETSTKKNEARSRNGRRRGGRRRIPDIAIDGGERLEAIASAPFLDLKTGLAAPDEGSDTETVTPAVEEAKASPEPANTQEPENTENTENGMVDPAEPAEPFKAEPADHETALEIQVPESLHSLHTPTEETSPPATRRRGWWSRSLDE